MAIAPFHEYPRRASTGPWVCLPGVTQAPSRRASLPPASVPDRSAGTFGRCLCPRRALVEQQRDTHGCPSNGAERSLNATDSGGNRNERDARDDLPSVRRARSSRS